MAKRLYRILPDNDTFCLEEVYPYAQGLHRRSVDLRLLVQRVSEAISTKDATGLGFYLACLVLTAGEEQQRRTVMRRAARRFRNVQHDLEHPRQLFKKVFKSVPLSPERPMSEDQFSDLLKQSMLPVRRALGLMDTNPVEFSYSIDAEILAAVQDPVCEKELERIATAAGGPLYPADLDYVEQVLYRFLPEDQAKKVVTLLKKTKNRKHLSALSVTTFKGGEGELYISMANSHGSALTLEGWKFVKLVEDREKPHLLATLSRLRTRGVESFFDFNMNKNGQVIAQFNDKSSAVIVLCRDEDSLEISDRARFVVDLDYVLCVYLALKRLREDREHFARLKEEADTTIHFDSFDSLFVPMRDKESL